MIDIIYYICRVSLIHFTMLEKTPEEVLLAITVDYKMRGISHADAARMLGMKSRQALANILYAKRYLSEKQAMRFHMAFGYNTDFLTSGKGELIQKDKSSNWTDVQLMRDIETVMDCFYEVISKTSTECLRCWYAIDAFVGANQRTLGRLSENIEDSILRTNLLEKMEVGRQRILEEVKGMLGSMSKE